MPSSLFKRDTRIRVGFYCLLACSCLLALVRFGPVVVWRRQAKRLVVAAFPGLGMSGAGGRFGSSDRYLVALQIDRPSEAILTALSGLAQNETAVLVIAEDDPGLAQIFLPFPTLAIHTNSPC